MTNTYRALTPSGEARFAKGVFEAEFSATEESDWLQSGVLELVPRQYRVLHDRFTIDGRPVDAVLTAAFPQEIEAALVSGGHLERVDPAPPNPPKKSKE